jgi:spermidine/putrescine transport system substrate-binding protein
MRYIPNFKYVAAQFHNPPYDKKEENGGKKYSIPYQWGTTGIGHRKDIVTDPITKWADLWNPKYKRRIVMLNDEREVLGSTLIMLGYPLNTTDQKQLDEAVAKDIEQKPLVLAYDSITTRREILSGVPLVQGWTGFVLMAYDALGPQKLEYVLPQEGFPVYCDNMAIPVGAHSPYAAHLFMNYILDPKVAGQLVNFTWYHSPVPDSRPYADKIVLSFIPSEDDMKRGQWYSDVGAFARQWTAAWAKIKSA